jgi:hypothetical protein
MNPPDYKTVVSLSKNAIPQTPTSQVHHKSRKDSRNPSEPETLIQWAEPHEGDDPHTAMLREFAKSKLYTEDNAKFCKGALNW